MAETNFFLIDNRIVKRNIRDGRITRAEYENYLKNLPDTIDNSRELKDEIFSTNIEGSDRPRIKITGNYMRDENDEE